MSEQQIEEVTSEEEVSTEELDQVVEDQEVEATEDEVISEKTSKAPAKVKEDDDEDEDDSEEDEDEDDEDDDEAPAAAEEKKELPKAKKVTSEDIDVSEDVEAMFANSAEDAEFKEKAGTIFEAAVVAKINEQLGKITAETEAVLQEQAEAETAALSEKVDTYLDYVVNEWVASNQIAIERGVKAEMVEDFMSGLKTLFTEHYVDIPEEKVEVVEELITKVEELEGKLNEETDKNVELTNSVKDFERNKVFAESAKDLTDTQVEKLAGLAEGVEFSTAEDFKSKLDMLKENYFEIKAESDVDIIDESEEVVAVEEEITEEKAPAGMAAYMNAISRSAK